MAGDSKKPITAEQLKAAARRAVEDNNIEAARRLIARARELEGSQPHGGSSLNQEAYQELGPKLRSMFAGVGQGGSLGFIDEGSGALTALMGGPVLPDGSKMEGTFGERYRAARDKVRSQQASRRTSEPKAYLGGQIAGGAAPALSTAPLAAGRTTLCTIGRAIAHRGTAGGPQPHGG